MVVQQSTPFKILAGERGKPWKHFQLGMSKLLSNEIRWENIKIFSLESFKQQKVFMFIPMFQNNKNGMHVKRSVHVIQGLL